MVGVLHDGSSLTVKDVYSLHFPCSSFFVATFDMQYCASKKGQMNTATSWMGLNDEKDCLDAKKYRRSLSSSCHKNNNCISPLIPDVHNQFQPSYISTSWSANTVNRHEVILSTESLE